MNGDDQEEFDDLEAEAPAGSMPTAQTMPVTPAAPPPVAAPVSPQEDLRRRFAVYDLQRRQATARQEENEWIKTMVERGLAEGLDRNSASARAAALYPAALGGGSEAAAFIKAIAPPPTPRQFPIQPGQPIQVGGRVYFPPASMFPQKTELTRQVVGGVPYTISPRTGAFREEKDPSKEARKNILVSEIKGLKAEIMRARGMGPSFLKRQDENIKRLAEAERELTDLGGSGAAVAPPSPSGPPSSTAPLAAPAARPIAPRCRARSGSRRGGSCKG